MTKDNKKKKKSKKKKRFSIIKIILILIVIVIFVGAGATIGIISATVRSAPDIDPTNILSMLSESSVILDSKGNEIEVVQTTEEREIISLDDLPEHLKNAFIAIEDHRFEEHFGIDIRRIVGSMLHNIQVRDLTAQGASTITQQLARNLYLSQDESVLDAYERKLKEMYLAIEIERSLSKDQILEYYLNTIPLGQSSFGIQSASFTYFSKDAKDLNIAESALLAGVPKADTRYAPFKRVNIADTGDVPQEDIVGYVNISGTKYACVFNQDAVDRQKTVLARMLELGYINDTEYETAMNYNIKENLSPGQKSNTEITSYFSDYVKSEVVEDLMDEYGYTYEQAENILFTGGLTIYSTMDMNIQKIIENSYKDFSNQLLGDTTNEPVPLIQEWRSFYWRYDGESVGNLDGDQNILNENGHRIYFKKENILTDNYDLYLTGEEYRFDESGNLIINTKKIKIYSNVLDIVDYYTIENDYLRTHNISGLNLAGNYEILSQDGTDGEILISKDYLESLDGFYKIDDQNNLLISSNYYSFDDIGIIQPQSAAVIMDYHTGEIKGLFGGRDITASKSYNRATRAARQPGSTIKPLSIYLPALDNGYTAASVIDDIPRYNEAGERWPKNWYENQEYKYWGLTTLRKSVEYSLNVNAVYMLENIGLDLSKEYLNKLHLIDFEDPENDTFITREENRAYNDENLASLALGGLTRGFTPLSMTAAYGAIANEGTYVEPICYTKVIDRNGKTILEKTPEREIVVSPEVAFIMEDILRTTVTQGLSHRAALPAEYGIEVAGKTGTTSDNADIWYMGFSPYYVGGIWIGNDDSQVKVNTGSGSTSRLWGNIMREVHAGMEPAVFDEPQGLVRANVCKQSGMLATDLCSNDQRGSQVISEYFVNGTVPTEFCDVHVTETVCSVSNMLLGPYCPPDLAEERVFIQRDEYYDPLNYPNVRNTSYQVKLEALKLYKQIQDEIRESGNTITPEQISQIYDGQVVIENGEIKSVNGIAVEDLYIDQMLTEDFQYQVPKETCTWHIKFHYDQWLEENSTSSGIQDGTTGSGIDGDSDGENNENSTGNEDDNEENNDENSDDSPSRED
jgi:penicillin-binding protein 1A